VRKHWLGPGVILMLATIWTLTIWTDLMNHVYLCYLWAVSPSVGTCNYFACRRCDASDHHRRQESAYAAQLQVGTVCTCKNLRYFINKNM